MKKQVLYFCILILLTLFFAISNEYILFDFLVFFEIFILAISWYVLTKIKNQFSFRLKTHTFVAEMNSPCFIEVIFENYSKLPIQEVYAQLVCFDCLNGRFRKLSGKAMVNKQGKVALRFQVSFAHCGYVRVELAKVELFDYLGILRIDALREPITKEIAVLPQKNKYDILINDFSTGILENSDGSFQQMNQDHGTDIIGVRPYRQGDKLNQVHWKLAVKLSELLVRETEEETASLGLVLLNLNDNQAKLTREQWDHFLESVGACCHYLIHLGYYHYVSWLDLTKNEVVRYMIETIDDVDTMLSNLVLAHRTNNRDIFAEYQEVYSYERIEHIISIDINGEIVG